MGFAFSIDGKAMIVTAAGAFGLRAAGLAAAPRTFMQPPVVVRQLEDAFRPFQHGDSGGGVVRFHFYHGAHYAGAK